ncbi:LETM1 domain-containing protein ylh47 [Diplodia seriata]|uniref:LETM1 domain-containing protein ylh47 n=1 Tax=Diplodia seriata TaxID=420778 RepID=A0ABR3CD99_9PEZI
MSFNRSASRVAPILLRSAARTPRRIPRSLPREISAIAILIPRHGYATDTSTSSQSSGNFPPPGFNAEQAKKPLPKEDQQKAQSALKSQVDKESINVEISKDSATAHPKTNAEEAESLIELAAEKATADKLEQKKLAKKVEEHKNLTLWQKVKKEANHYWDGTKLLGTEVRISTKLALKMAAGYELTRRENRQLRRTVQDLGRLVPFSVFVLVPFAELLLPVALKLFPNMLPSTYEGQKSKDNKITSMRATRKEVSDFLRHTLQEGGLPVSAANAQRDEFTQFFRKIRSTGEEPTQADVIKVCKIFKDDLTLDNLSRPQLVGICKYLGLNTFGTDNILRYQVRHRMRQIKRDDKMIFIEGVESLSVPELQNACGSRGLRTHGVSPARLREDLQMWLNLRLKYGVPSTLLVLSNAFMYGQGKETEMETQIDALKAVLSSIPEELFHEIELEVHNAEGAATNKQRLEVLKEQQELIEEENEQSGSSAEATASSTPKDDKDIDEKEEAEAEEKQQVQAKADEAATEKPKVEAKKSEQEAEKA